MRSISSQNRSNFYRACNDIRRAVARKDIRRIQNIVILNSPRLDYNLKNQLNSRADMSIKKILFYARDLARKGKAKELHAIIHRVRFSRSDNKRMLLHIHLELYRSAERQIKKALAEKNLPKAQNILKEVTPIIPSYLHVRLQKMLKK